MAKRRTTGRRRKSGIFGIPLMTFAGLLVAGAAAILFVGGKPKEMIQGLVDKVKGKEGAA